MSKFVRPQHCHQQIAEQQQRNNGYNCFHRVLELVAEANVDGARDKKPNDQGREN
jgi:hypothetical protein